MHDGSCAILRNEKGTRFVLSLFFDKVALVILLIAIDRVGCQITTTIQLSNDDGIATFFLDVDRDGAVDCT